MKCERKGYQLLSLGSFSNMKYGKMPKKDMVKENGKYPVFSGYRIVGYCDECNLDEQQLIVIARGVGGTGDVKLSPGACYLTNLSIAVMIDENIALKQYLFYYFQKHNLRYLDSGSAQSQITIADLKNIVLPIPPLEIQSKMVAILSSLDEKIELNNKINENLLEQMQLLYQGLLTNCDYSLIRLGDIAQKIAMGPFGSNIKVSTFVSVGVPIISGNHLRSVFLEEPSYNFITEEHAQKLKNSIVYPRDIIFTHAGNIGQVAMIPVGCNYPYYMISQRQFYMRCDETKVIPELVLFFFHSREGKGKLLSNANSTGVPSIAQPSTHLKNIEMPLPDKKDQDAWYKMIRPMVDEYVTLCQENKRLTALRDSLLPRLMSGEIDVEGVRI